MIERDVVAIFAIKHQTSEVLAPGHKWCYCWISCYRQRLICTRSIGLANSLTERFAFFIVEVTLFNTVPKAFQRTRLIWVRTVDKDSRMLSFQRESEVYVRTEPVRNIYQAELIEFVVNLWKGVLEHVLFALKNS